MAKLNYHSLYGSGTYLRLYHMYLKNSGECTELTFFAEIRIQSFKCSRQEITKEWKFDAFLTLNIKLKNADVLC